MRSDDENIRSIFSRRRLLELIGGSSLTGLAGCSTKDEESTEANGSTESQSTPEPLSKETARPTAQTETVDEDQTVEFEYDASIPDSIIAGTLVRISVEVQNIGNVSDSNSIQLKFGGRVVDSETVQLEPNDTANIEFGFRTYNIGNHEIAINDNLLGEMTVRPFGTPVEDRSLSRRLGATHTNSKYRFGNGDLLNEGAKVLENLGVRAFKGWMHRPDVQYPWTEWPEFESMVDIFDHPHYQELFNRPFDTYAFVVFAHTRARETGGAGYFFHEFSRTAEREEEASFYELTKYLLEEYDGTGKEFLLQNWEGDWVLAGGTGEEGPLNSEVLERGKRWWNARQRGITRARQEVESDAAVLGVCEINKVRAAMADGERWIVNSILEDLEVDLVSYSAWDLCSYLKDQPSLTSDVRQEIHDTLGYIEERAPNRSDYLESVLGSDSSPVFVGEFGWPLREGGPEQTMHAVRGIVEESMAWGAPYILFWQTYDNEVYIDGEKVIVDPNIETRLEEAFGGYAGVDDVRGFYLIRPDGLRSPVWFYYADQLGTHQNEFVQVELQYDSVRLESEVNPAVAEKNARKLAIGCNRIEAEVDDESVSFDIGSTGNEVAFLEGMYARENTNQFTFRWFGGEKERTAFYLPYSRHGVTGSPSVIRFDAWGVEGGISADILVDGEEVGSITFDDSRSTYIIGTE